MKIFRSAAVALTCCIALIANAQESDMVLEEVVVMATKREQTLQEVSVAVSVVSADTIEKSQINDIIDLQTAVPSLRVTQLQSSGQTNFLIRGFGNGANNPGIEPSVGVFIDGVYRSRSASAIADLPNIERIEVLRGPQSTLFGKNASAGVINIVTAAPNMDEFGGSASVTFGNYNEIIAKADISGPLGDRVAFSLSGNTNNRDGYFENLQTGNSINERDRWGVRGQLLFDATDRLSFRLIGDYDEIDELCCGVANLQNGPAGVAIALVGGQVVANEPYAYENYLDFDPTNKIENKGISLQADFEFDSGMEFTSITAWRDQSRVDDADVDFTGAKLVERNIGSTNLDTFTQEFRLSHSTDSVDWLLGAYYFDEEVSYDNELYYDVAFRPYADILSGGCTQFGCNVTGLEFLLKSLGLIPPEVSFFGAGQGGAEMSTQTDETISVYGQLDWHITDRLTLTGGLNYTTVDKDAAVSQVNTDVFSSLDFVQIGGGLIYFQLLQAGFPPQQAAAIAASLSQVPCSAQTGPQCNQLLGFQALQFLPPFLNYPNSVEPGVSSDDKTTWTLRAAFELTDNINVYLGAATGFKATSWNLSRDSRPFASDLGAIYAAGLAVPNLTAGTRYAGPEEATVYELGFKGGWDRTSLYLTLFEQEIEGFQSNIFTGTGFVLANAGKQSTSGVEVEANWLATDRLDLSFAGTWLNPKYDSFVGGSGVGGPEDLSGRRPAGIPRFAMNASATFNFNMGSIDAFIRGEYVHESDVQVVDNVSADLASREVNMVNASFGMAFSNGLEAMIWGRNLSDDNYLLSAFPAVAQAGSYSGYPSQPRTYGITLTARF